MYKLSCTVQNQKQEWDIEPGTYIVGRKSDCDICIPLSTISRKHFELEVTPNGRLFVSDLGSQNGTIINMDRITEKKEISQSDRIIIGETVIKISGDQQGGKQASTSFIDRDSEKSVMIPFKDIMKPLPSKVTERPEVLKTFFEMAKIVVMSDPMEVMLEKALDLISNIIPTDRLAVLKVDDVNNADDFYIAVSKSKSGDMGQLNISKTIVKKIISDKTAFFVSDLMSDPNLAQQQSVIISKIKSAMAVPLLDEGDVLGVLYADSSDPLHTYNEQYLNLFAAVGNILASRMINYELLEVRAEQQLFEAEVRRASSIQKKLLMIPKPTIDSYSITAWQDQCRAVGGDLFDMRTLPNGNLIFLVADVSGKGMGAALLMSNILASFRILYNAENIELSQIVKQVSEQLFAYSAPEDFATLFIGLLDPKENILQYINAGHNPPILSRADETFEYLKPSGIMIGAMPMMEWELHSITMNEGDIVTIYTDGVTEAESSDGQYGEDRLEKFIVRCCQKTPEELTAELVKDIESFTADTPQSDDITMMVLKRCSNS